MEYVSSTIEICKWRPPKDTVHTFAHELWHAYWFQEMTIEERKEYKKLFDKKIAWYNPINSLKWDYEDFADIFALVTLNKEIEPKLQEKADYVKSILK